MALVHPVQSDGPTASAPSPTRRSKSPPGGHKLGLVEDAHGVHPRKLVRTGTGPIVGGGGGEPEKQHEANGVGPPALPPHPEPLRKSDSQCSNDGQRLWSQRALSPGAALWPGELAKEGDTAAKRALDCKGEEDGDDGDDDEATAPLAPLSQPSSRLTTGLEGPMSVHGSIGHTVVDDGVEAKPILRKTSSFAHPSDGTMHLRKQGRQLSFADEQGRNLHVVIHATNLQYSSRRVRRGSCCTVS